MNPFSASELFIAGFDGQTLPQTIKKQILDYGLGGLIVFRRNIESLNQVILLNGSILQLNESPALPFLSVDQEGGRVARLRGICTDLPPIRTLAEAFRENPKLPYRLGAMMARELVALGFHLSFAPVCDVDSNPKNPVIGDRSFSDNALEVGEWAKEWILGMQGAGLAACAKHFPGHGDTDSDSHLTLPSVLKNKEQLFAQEIHPFTKAIEADVATIMTAHVLYPALDEHYLATLSPIILNQILRRELGFKGLIISDDLAMAGIKDRYSFEEMIENGLRAGLDMFIVGNDFQKTLDCIDLTQSLLKKSNALFALAQAAVNNIRSFKRLYMGTPAQPSLAYAQKIVKCDPHMGLTHFAK